MVGDKALRPDGLAKPNRVRRILETNQINETNQTNQG
jgi:hypothetical protein